MPYAPTPHVCTGLQKQSAIYNLHGEWNLGWHMGETEVFLILSMSHVSSLPLLVIKNMWWLEGNVNQSTI